MPNTNLKTKDACRLLGLDENVFKNYFKNAEEFLPIPRPNGRGIFYFDPQVLTAWKQSYNERTVILTLEDYTLCLDFALAMHFRGYVTSDFGSGRQREFGQKITNWVKGQLGEVAVKKFFQDEFNTSIELDFEIRDAIVPQDIVGVIDQGTSRQTRIGIGIKSSKPKGCYLVLGENEIEILDRRSDFYIFCRPDIADDHLLRITKDEIRRLVEDKPHYHLYQDKIPSFENIPCEIAGWCSYQELEKVTSIPGQDFDGSRYVIKSGKLHKSRNEWQELINRL